MSEQEVEAIAAAQFEYVGDEGLFPNYTNKDIWMAGFVAAYFHFHKEPARFQSTFQIVNGKWSKGKTKRIK